MSGDFYFEPEGNASYESNIKRSRFIANVILCRNEAAAKERLKELCVVHRQANHNCWAYVLGTEPLTERSSDAGEPQGAAGRPIMGEIKRSGLTNVLVVVTRYFGGIKLGIRGLIEAYSMTAAQALALCPRAERMRMRAIKVYFPYNSMGSVTHLLGAAGNEGELRWDFSPEQCENCVEEVSISADFKLSAFPGLIPKLDEMKDRKIITEYEIMETKENFTI
ncbi:MAG: YigZ family protein [Synergistaceae bacterium]|nr:YigZ family protein [Synergistaceae bacterium]